MSAEQRPIGKGSRFRVLTGALRGREATVLSATDDGQRWRVVLDEYQPYLLLYTAELEETVFQRLADAPAEVDPIFAELAALDAERLKAWGASSGDDAARPIDEWLHFANVEIERADETIGDPEAGGDAVFRDAMMQAAMLCLAAVRVIDRSR